MELNLGVIVFLSLAASCAIISGLLTYQAIGGSDVCFPSADRNCGWLPEVAEHRAASDGLKQNPHSGNEPKIPVLSGRAELVSSS